MPAFTTFVEGIPIAQGSLISNGLGRGLRHSNEPKLKPWRYAVVNAINASRPQNWDPSLPLSVTATFRFPRPAAHYGTGRNSTALKPASPTHHIVKPDLDKLTRALGDSIEASGLLRGDQQIVSWNISKRYCLGDETPGVLLTLIAL
jgi:Holliday junction resolvase RusA-like endonuclease